MGENMLSGIAANDIDRELLDRCVTAATEWLHSRTWRRFRGLRAVELRPCGDRNRSLGAWWAWSGWYPWRGNPNPAPVIEGNAQCGCSIIHEIQLPDDVQLVTSVKIDGAVFTDWRLDAGHRLVRTDDQAWPCCSDMEDPDTEDGTFSIHAIVGKELLEFCRLAASEFAAELYLGSKKPEACRTSARATSVVRQGVTYTTISGLTQDGRTASPRPTCSSTSSGRSGTGC